MGEPIKRKPRRIDDQLRLDEPLDDKFGEDNLKGDEGKKKALRSIISKRRATGRDGEFNLER